MGNKSISASHIKSNSTCLARSAVRRSLNSDLGLSAREIETFVLVNGVKAVAEGLTAITARLLTDSFNRIIVVSTIIGAITGLVGLFLSYYLDIVSGASIVLLQALVFTVALWISSLQKTAGRRLVQTDL